MGKNIKDDLARFHHHYYNGVYGKGPIYLNTYWMGIPTQKCPLDMWIYQELFFELRPDLVIETGTNAGGSALFMAHLCDLLNNGHVATIDIETQPRPEHKRITYIHGSSAKPKIVQEAASCVPAAKIVLVILDSDHRKKHVSKELELFSPLVSPGSYLIVEDTNVNGNPVLPSYGPGPYEAVQEFLARDPTFEIDSNREKFLMTFNPSGFLRRKGGTGTGI